MYLVVFIHAKYREKSAFSSLEFKWGLFQWGEDTTTLYVPADSSLVTFDPSGYFGQS